MPILKSHVHLFFQEKWSSSIHSLAMLIASVKETARTGVAKVLYIKTEHG